MTVNIDVTLNKIDGSDIAKVKAQLQSLDEDLDLDFDLEKILDGEFGDIEIDIDKEHLKNQIKKVAKSLKAEGAFVPAGDQTSGDSGDKNRATIKDLQNELRRINGQLGSINNKTGAISTSKSSSDNDSTRTPPLNVDVSFPERFSGNDFQQTRVGQSLFSSGPRVSRIEGSILRDSLKLNQVLDSDKAPSTGSSKDVDVDRSRSALKNLRRSLSAVSLASSNITNSLGKLRPTFRQVRAIIYTLLPALIGLGAQLVSVAAGITALTGAAGAAVALGLLGGASETLEGSMASAEERVNSLKRELFQVIEPIADLFAPITDDLFGEVVSNVRGLTDEMAALRPLSDILFDGLGGFGVIIEETLQSIIQLGPELQQMAGIFGSILTSGLPEFFSNLFVEGIKTSDTLIKVAGVAFQLGRMIYFVSKAIASLLGVFAVFTPVLKLIADLLGSRIGQSLIIIAGLLTSLIVLGVVFGKIIATLTLVIGALNTAMGTQIGILGVLKSTWTGQWIISAIGAMQSLIAWVMGLNSALATTAALVSIATLGLAALAGVGALAVSGYGAIKDTMNPETPRRERGSGNTYNDVTMNFHGDMDNKSRHKMEDVARGVMYQDDLSNGNFGTSQ